MRRARIRRWVALGLTAAVSLCAFAGCASVRSLADAPAAGLGAGARYLENRAVDALDTVDIGLTFSTKPQYSFYANFASITPGGYGHVDGHFVGIAGGRIGPMRHYQGSVGLLAWGYEEVGWGEFDKNDLTTLNTQGVGALGLLAPPYGRPASAPS